MENAKNNSQTLQQWELKYALTGVNACADTVKEFDSMHHADVTANQHEGEKTVRSIIHFSTVGDRMTNMVTKQQFNEIVNPLNIIVCAVGGA